MASLPHKFSDPWLNRDEACQTDDPALKTTPGDEKNEGTKGSRDSGFRSEETIGGFGVQTEKIEGNEQMFESKESLASQTSVRSKQYGRRQPDEISDPWKREKNVVVAVDGSDQSDRALDFYLDNMHKMEYQIVLTHCADIPRIPLCDEIPREEWNTELKSKDKSVKLLEEDYAAKLRNEGVNFKTRFLYHPKPGCGILQVAEEEGAAFIVTGSRGLGRKRKTILGSVSDYIIHHSKLPVVICPAEKVQYRYHYDSASQVIKSRVELDLIQEAEDFPKLRLSQEDLSASPDRNPSPGLSRRSFVLIDI